jgi:hypothetical protein
MTISNVSEQNSKASSSHPSGGFVIAVGTSLDRLVEYRAPKISRNRKLIWNSGFFVRGCRIRKTNFSRGATPGAG